MSTNQVRARTTPKKPAAEPVAVARGRALKQAIHVARARAGILYDTDLAVRAGVSYDTLMNWYGGRTRPRGKEMQRVASTLGVPYASLEAAYEGRDPEPQPLQDAVRDLTGAVRELVTEMREDRGRLTRRVEDSAAAFEDVVRLLREQQPKDGGEVPPATNRAP
jgi:transcriptional regulator with XRE-family HTH domain